MPNWDQIILADGPTAWYKLGGTYADTVAGGTTGTSTGTVVGTTALTNDRAANSAVDFTSGRISVPAQAKLNLLNNFSIECLVQFDTVYTGLGTRAFVQKVNTAGTLSWGIGNVDGVIGGWVANSGGTWFCFTDITPVPNRVYHIVMTYNAVGEIIVYVDGDQRGSKMITSGTAATDFNGILSIGADWSAAIYLDGKMDEVVFWNRPLEKKEVQEHHIAARDNSWGDYMLDRLSEQILRDWPTTWLRCSRGGSLDMMGGDGATLVNGATIVSTPRVIANPNKSIDALSLDGVNDYATLPAQVKTDSSTWGWTVSCWIRPTNVTGTKTVIHRTGDYTIKIVDGVLQASTTTAGGTFTRLADNAFFAEGGPGNPMVVGGTYNITVMWRHHTFWGSSLYLFCNGNQIGEITTTGDPTAVTSNQVFIGALNGTSEFFAGQIGELAIWDKAIGVKRVQKYLWMGIGLEDPFARPFDIAMDELVELSWDPGFEVLKRHARGDVAYVTSWDSKAIMGIPSGTLLTTGQAIYKNNADLHEDYDLQMFAFPPPMTGTETGRMYFHLNHDGEFAGNDGPWWGRNGYTLWLERLSTGVIQGSVHKYASFTDTIIGAATTISGLPWSDAPGWLVRFRKRGTQLRWKVWAADAREPSAWNQTITDPTPLKAGYWGMGATNGSPTNYYNFFFDYARVHGDRRSKSIIVAGVEKELVDQVIFGNSFGTPTEFLLAETYPDRYVEVPPYVRASTTALGDATAALVINKPTCYPGDILYLFGAADTQAITGVTGATWQELYSGAVASTQLTGTKVWRRIVEGTEPASFTMTMAAACDNAAVCVAVGGGDLETPEAAGVLAQDGNNTSPVIPGQDPLYDNGLLLGVALMRDDATPDTFTKPASMTLAAAAMSTLVSVAVASESLPSGPGTGTPFTSRTATRSSSAPWRGLSLAVRAKRAQAEGPIPTAGLVARWVAADLGLNEGDTVLHNTWADRVSGRLLQANRATAAAAQPIFAKASLINGKPAVRFDGTTDNMYVSTATFTATAASIGVIFRPDVNNAIKRLVRVGQRQLYMRANGTSGFTIVSEIGGTVTISTTAPHAMMVTSPTTGIDSIYLDGKNSVSADAGNPSAHPGDMEIGTVSNGTSGFFDGDIAEVWIWDHNCTIYEIMDFMRYAEKAYGVLL